MPHRFASALAALVLAVAPVPAADATGEQIYRKQCASCHGANGEGVKPQYPHALAGDKSPAQLAKLIAKTMPEDNPGTCVGEDADKVARYIHDAFYSKVARERSKPARIELARLTVNQYRQTVADLVGSFRPRPAPWADARGLKGEYFAARNFRNEKKTTERTDPGVSFDWGTKSPTDDKIDPAEFSARWSGTLMPPASGGYEFVVRTDHAVRLWVNNTQVPLIDAWVKSGTDTTFRGSIFLLAGRPVPVRLEFSKAKQGVDDSKKDKPKPPPKPAFIHLEWKRPGSPAEVIPARFLSPTWAPEALAVETPFPPDDRSYGWERGTAVSKAWDQATTDAAFDTATYVAAKVNELAGTNDKAGDRAAKVRAFAEKFAERAFRRPLSPELKAAYIDRPFANPDADAAVKLSVLMVLKSPRFLYREVGGGPDAYDVAARLAFALWDAPPDADLLKEAAAGKLATPEQVRKQAERMLTDPRAKAKLLGFFHHWLAVEHAGDVSKDPKRFPDFDPAVVADLRASLDLFLEDVVWGSGSDFRKLLLSDETFLNERLAKFYGVRLPDGAAGFVKVPLDPGKRSGVLTHPFLLAAFAYTGESSPIHRGVFLARGVLGQAMRPPPEAVSPLAPDLHPSLTTRERVLLQTKPAACQTCHNVINPLGFTLENFDAVGRFREKDHGKAVDPSGAYQTRAGQTVTFKGARDLAKFVAGSEEVHAAFAEQLFHHLAQQSVRAYGPDTLERLRAGFAANSFDVRKLAVEVAVTAALKPRENTVASVK